MNQSLEGVFGETGPFSSAGCINTIYKQNQSEVDQEKPRLGLFSDLSIQDRTTGIQKDENEFIDKNLALLWEKLQLCEVDYVILPCMTSHYFVRQFPMGIDEQMISLIDLTIREVEGSYSESILYHEELLSKNLNPLLVVARKWSMLTEKSTAKMEECVS